MNKDCAFSFDQITNLFYYTTHNGRDLPIGCKYNGKINIFLNLPPNERESIKTILKKLCESYEVYIDATRHNMIHKAFNNLLNLSTKRIVYAVIGFDGAEFKVLNMPNTARSSKPRNVSAVLTVPYNRIPNELRRIVKGIVDNGSYLIESGRTYIPAIIYAHIESCLENTKSTTPKEVGPGDVVLELDPNGINTGDRIFAVQDAPEIATHHNDEAIKHLGRSVSENIEPEVFEEKISEKPEPDIKPSDPVRNINTKDEKDSDLVGKLNDFDIKLVPPTKKASISLSNKLLLI